MSVYFCNDPAIDLDCVRVLGVSVKTGDNPIGFFGTGLRFAIATLLRTGHKVVLVRDGVEIEFCVKTETIRGEEFERVYMGDEPLGFTAMLGRTWEPWQAYRELYCNCTDENGIISDEIPEGRFGTVFKVTGEAIEKCHRERHTIFLATKPIASNADCEIHRGSGRDAFYRGVRAHRHSEHALYTYNIKEKMDLTEDRTLKYGFYVGYHASRLIPTLTDEDILYEILTAPRGTFERCLDYDVDVKPSPQFMDVVLRSRLNGHLNQSALKLWEKHAEVKFQFEECELDAYEEQVLRQAFVLLKRLNCPIERRDFLVVDGLGESVFGAVRRQQILIAKRAFDMGSTFVASTLFEEWLHRDQKFRDESRDLQNFLFEKLFSLVARLCVIEGKMEAA